MNKNKKQKVKCAIDNKISNEKEFDFKKYSIVTSLKKGTLIITEELQEQIDQLHNFVGEKEWSGVLLFTIDKGDISEDELEVTAHSIYPMDIGTHSYTEFELEENTIDIFDMYPKILDNNWRMGLCHSHNNFSCFFSGTDLDNLKEFTPHHAYYLSLIVNFDGNYCAKLCVLGKRTIEGTSNFTIKNTKGIWKKLTNNIIKKEEDIVYTIDLNIARPETKSSVFMELVRNIDKKKQESKNKLLYNNYNRQNYDYENNYASPWIPINKRQNTNETQTSLFSDKSNNLSISFTDLEVEDFLYKLISEDKFKTQGILSDLILEKNNWYSRKSFSEQEDWCDKLNEEYLTLFYYLFPEKNPDEGIEVISFLASKKLQSMKIHNTDEFIEDIILILENYIDVSLTTK